MAAKQAGDGSFSPQELQRLLAGEDFEAFWSRKDEELPRVCSFLELVWETNQQMNLTAFKDSLSYAYLHAWDSLTCLPWLRSEQEERGLAEVWDLGTGAGFPGMVLALCLPEVNFVLIDALAKRCAFLERAAQQLGCQNVQVLHARAEDLGRAAAYRGRAPFVVARAVAALPTLLELALPLCRQDGAFLAMKGRPEAQEFTEAQQLPRLLGAELERQTDLELPVFDQVRSFWLFRQRRPCPSRYPRHYGQIKKKPLCGV